jgi:hypothetical protein
MSSTGITRSADTIRRDAEPAGWVRGVALAGAVAFLLFGVWALVAPQSFFDSLATFEPYNPHLLHDIGAFQIGLGAALALAAFPERVDGLGAALLGVGIGAAMHVVSHLVDLDLGGTPATDVPTLSVLALALLAAGASRVKRQG